MNGPELKLDGMKWSGFKFRGNGLAQKAGIEMNGYIPQKFLFHLGNSCAAEKFARTEIEIGLVELTSCELLRKPAGPEQRWAELKTGV